MAKFKLGVIKRQIVEECIEIEVEAPDLATAVEQTRKRVEGWELGDADETLPFDEQGEVVDVRFHIGTWDEDGLWCSKSQSGA